MSFQKRLDDYFELAKPRITTLLLVVALASYSIAAGPDWTWAGFFVVAVSVGALGTGIFALNHVVERRQDALMVRTRDRPLPAGRVPVDRAIVFGGFFAALGIVISFFAANVLTGVIALFTAVSYLGVYTPLKYRTSFHTALGAIPGAVPPLAGWAVATGHLSPYAWVLFAVLFLWQFPHFLSIEMLYRDDYARANVKVLPVVDRTGFWVSFQILGAQSLLILFSVAPLLWGSSTWWSAALMAILGFGFLWSGVQSLRLPTPRTAKSLLRASVMYLPLVFVVLYFHP